MSVQPPDYSAGIPQPKDQIKMSALPFLDNFTVLYNAFMQNHVKLDGGATAGNHTIIQMPQQSTSFQTDATEMSINGKLGPGSDVSGNPTNTTQMSLKYQDNATEFPYTAYQIYPVPNEPTQFFSYLPGGVIVYFGLKDFGSTINKNAFIMSPALCKQIITVNFSPSVAFRGWGPSVSIGTPDGHGIINAIFLKSFPPFNPTILGKYYYVILGNL